jgi:toxin ParE1/3/4
MDRALSDLPYLYEWIGAESGEAAAQWYNGLEDAIYSLEEQPARCPRTPESDRYRHLLYGHKPHIYRVIYRVLEKQKQVDVLHITSRGNARLRSREINVGRAKRWRT